MPQNNRSGRNNRNGLMEYPLHSLLARFWQVLLDDLMGRGCVGFEDVKTYSPESVRIKREKLKKEAEEFLSSPEFVMWAEVSNLDPDVLRKKYVNYQHKRNT